MKKPLAVLLLIAVFPGLSYARDWKTGLYSSPEGFGLCHEWAGIDNSFHSVSVWLDCFDRMFGNGGKVGAAANYSRHFTIRQWQAGSLSVMLYAGPGFSTGFVRDRGESFPGLMAGVTGSVGMKFDFNRGIGLDVSFCATAGFQVNAAESNGPVLDWYRRGLTHIPMPRIKIMFPLR